MTQAQGEKIRKWDEVNGAQEQEQEKAQTPEEQRNGPMIAPGISKERDYLKSAEEQIEDDFNSIDGILNNGHWVAEVEEQKIRERESVMEKLREQERKAHSIPPAYPAGERTPLCPERNPF